ncbi:MAG: carboxypeptidase-like regulatory domain-containing protein, partial [Methanothrix sp.]|nr:carboxypeptidase-like regulatory domain-containing protein [Methanothrix sp.]
MRLKLILAANLIAILLFAGLNCNALPFLETPTVSDEELGRIQGTLQSSAATVSGRVYEGDFRDESKPFPNVRVELCCSNDQKNRGRVVESATTDAKGWYELTLPSGCEFYDIVVTVPEGYIAAGADSAGGDVIDENWIQYGYPLDRSVLTGNKFWIKKSVPELPLIPLRPLVPVTPQEPETVSCPKGCECMTEEMAKEEFGK